jgi:hypothetical protein
MEAALSNTMTVDKAVREAYGAREPSVAHSFLRFSEIHQTTWFQQLSYSPEMQLGGKLSEAVFSSAIEPGCLLSILYRFSE